MNLAKVFLNWFDIANGKPISEHDPFYRFISLWIAFNSYFSFKFGVRLGDKRKVIQFAKEKDAIDLHKTLMIANYDYRSNIAKLSQKGVKDLKNGKISKITDETNLEQVMLYVYTVRCNLFHGNKLTDDFRDRELVEASLGLLLELVTIIQRHC